MSGYSYAIPDRMADYFRISLSCLSLLYYETYSWSSRAWLSGSDYSFDFFPAMFDFELYPRAARLLSYSFLWSEDNIDKETESSNTPSVDFPFSR